MSGLTANLPSVSSFTGNVDLSDRTAARKPVPFQVLRPTVTLQAPNVNSALSLIARCLPIQRRLMRQGDVVYGQGDSFGQIFVVNSGNLKLLSRDTDGRERITKFRFKGDWVGLDGLFSSHYGCDAVCMDTCEIWSFTYAQLVYACEFNETLMDLLLRAMSHDLSAARDQMTMLCTLPTKARVAQFLCYWVEALRSRQLRTDQITLRLSREEMGSHLGMTLESVSRSLCLLERRHLIHFMGKGRREICIPNVSELVKFIHGKDGDEAEGDERASDAANLADSMCVVG